MDSCFTREASEWITKTFWRDTKTIPPKTKQNLIQGMVALAKASESGVHALPEVLESAKKLNELFHDDDIKRELLEVTRREKQGHINPDIECPHCGKNECYTKQIHTRLGTDEGATRFICCTACGRNSRA